ncbi:DUF4097 family beta strand repeat-containing protein [Allofustis seminis]|uniref:DUF4097 family beta strand repeat-containing protein n=1 Tax=Allofustis seminis TaxID=166939 RepID=UPI00036723D4|nr:DUF4097 family beta strand repeat-containing protein [Allofustis seminis]
MENKKRIIELVEKGILSTEEALKLLENLGEKEAEHAAEVNFTTQRAQDKVTQEINENNTSTVSAEQSAQIQKNKKQEKEATEKQNAQLKALETKRKELEEKITHLSSEEKELQENIQLLTSKQNEAEAAHDNKLKQLQTDVATLEDEIKVVQQIHEEVDVADELAELLNQLSTKQRELESFESENELEKDIVDYSSEIATLKEKFKKVINAKDSCQKELHQIKMTIWSDKASSAIKEIEIPEDWQQKIGDTVSDAGSALDTAVNQMGGFLSGTLNKLSHAVNEFEWKDTKEKLQKGVLSETITKTWTFDQPDLTVLDFKNANGMIHFYQAENDAIKVEAQMRMLGYFDGTLEEAISQRMEIEAIQGQLKFHIPNKKVQAHLKIWLPPKTYDYLYLRSLNGDIHFEPLKVKDITLNVTNGAINFDHLEATLLELKGTNGDISLKEAQLRDLVINTVSGDVRIMGAVQNAQINTVNGTIRETLYNEDIIRITNQTVNGTIKIAIPSTVGLEGTAQTTFGNIHTRLQHLDDLKTSKARKVNILRSGQTQAALEISTTAGSIFLKDNEENELKIGGRNNEKTN